MKKKRLFGYRPLCFAALFLILGILIGALCQLNFVAVIVMMIFSLITVVLIALIKPTRKFVYLAIFLFVGFLSITILSVIYNRTTLESGDYELTGQVESEITKDDNFYFTLSNIVVAGKKYKGKASVYYKSEDVSFCPGDYITIKGSLKGKDSNFFDNYFSSNLTKKKYYTIFTSNVEFLNRGKLNLISKAELKVKQNFYENCRPDTADIATALIFGDKSTMNENLYEDIKVSGLAHTLAVSGLHISILAGFIVFILKKCKVKPLVRFIVVGVLLFIYLIFCDFAPSAVRAFIMTLYFMFSSLVGEKHDSMNALALSCIIILFINPAYLFTIGFQLSVFAVIGIFMFYRFFIKVFKRENKFTSLVSTSISANIMTYPVVASSFKSFPILFLISNLLILPIMSFMYIGIILFTLITLIIPFPQMLIILDYILIPLKAVALTFGSLTISSIVVPSLGIMGFAYYVSATVLSRYIFLRQDYKWRIVLGVLSVCLFLTAIFPLVI